ncbi:MAG: PrsW family glutamic-type intramembrane protease [Spirochaetia bacterium]|jgi:RsiW-degrading membrane proteinase PrsW (M82 family)
MALFAVCVLIAALSGAAWFGIILLIDPHRREKGSATSLFISLVFGFASIPLVIFLYAIAPDLSSGVRNPGGQLFIYEMLVVGPVEEFAKFFIFFLIMLRQKPVQEPLDGMLHAAAVALAFSLAENVKYGLIYGADLTAVRAFLSTPAHLTFACVWGFAYSVMIHANPRRRPRDYVVLFFSIYPAALLHGLSNFLPRQIGDWAFLVDGAELLATFSLLLWLQRKSPFRPFRLGEAAQAVQRIDMSLASNGNSFPLHLRAALARAALGDYGRAQGHIDRCLKLRKGDAFTIALSGVIMVLQGETARGEEALRFSYTALTTKQKLTLVRLSRHVARAHRTDNAYNEFLLSMWMKNPGDLT